MAKVFNVNVKAHLDAMSSDSRFTDVGEGETKIFRFGPPVTDDGLIFYRTRNHYKLKTEERGIALADLQFHGTEETGNEDYIAQLSEVLLTHGTDAEKKIGKDIKGNNRYYGQGWEATPMEDGSFKYSKCRLMSIPKTAAEAVLKIFKNQAMMNQAAATDPEKGQAILISREGTGFNTRYSAERSGDIQSLDEIIPGWQDQLFDDVYEAIMLNVYPPDEQKKIAQFTYPELDWDKLESEFGL